ncbi:hypothetical protein Athai_59970 [Actinocatenispora thailandica]|uniref:Lipoprotein n=1 Tax=Actinocatenispora thailandica TaxID=227318 RepID=A0A7R7I0G1_9ACTN|nr:hypothetical protein [Actinocatenispora thailandica]BCJ38494.1 hypothetical protein Athai_59970 [Actinocatenispora thailandica]
MISLRHGAGPLVGVVVLSSLAACGSNPNSGRPKQSAAATPETGRSGAFRGKTEIRYPGGVVRIRSVSCAVEKGKIVGLNAPDTDDETTPTPPSFTAADLGENSTATLHVAAGSYVKAGAAGITSARRNGVWTMTLSGTELGSVSTQSDPITVNGTITCGRTITMG